MITVIFESQVDVEQGVLAWQQGLALLLSASDVDGVQAVFMGGVESLRHLPLSLGKKLQQLELYEIASYCLLKGEHEYEQKQEQEPKREQEVKIENGLDWSWVEMQSAEGIRRLLEQGGQLFTV